MSVVLAELALPDPPLADSRLMLRPWGPDDLADLLAAAADPVVHRYRYSLPADEDSGRAWLAAVDAERERGERLELAVTAAGDATAVGSVCLWGFHARNRTGTVSYWLAPAGRGRGLATGAIRLLAAWAFSDLGLLRLGLKVEVDNLASQRVAERCGFGCEGRMRSDQRLRDGTRADILIYGLLPGELVGGRVDGANAGPTAHRNRI